jgi:hypothetical protein
VVAAVVEVEAEAEAKVVAAAVVLAGEEEEQVALAEVARAERAEAKAVVLAATTPRLPSMPQHFGHSCTALRRYASPRRRISRS